MKSTLFRFGTRLRCSKSRCVKVMVVFFIICVSFRMCNNVIRSAERYSNTPIFDPMKLSRVDYLPTGLIKSIRNYNYSRYTAKTDNEIFRSSYKIILLYTGFFGIDNWALPLGSEVFDRLRCPVSNCVITSDRSFTRVSDALFFHADEIDFWPPLKERHGSKQQKWIFFSMECPQPYKLDMLRKRSALWRSMFDYTSTYRLDSDFPYTYGIATKRDTWPTVERKYPPEIYRKKKLIAWLVSNCNTESLRMPFIKKLKHYIPVDVYGACGEMNCTRNITCEQMVNSTYKFYFAAENTFCKDYVTEKLYRTMQMDVVPVVRGGADYSMLLPPDTFIDTRNFTSMRALAEYLKYLDKHPTEYIKYLKNKEAYNIKTMHMANYPTWCKLCEELNSNKKPKRVYEDIVDWWEDRGCSAAPDLNLIYDTWFSFKFHNIKTALVSYYKAFKSFFEIFFISLLYQ